jgi:hypothetical protein
MNFPSWLPEDVAIHAEFELRTPDEDHTVIRRLVTDDRMREVWEKLSKEAPDAQSQRVEALIDYVVSALDYWRMLKQWGLLLTRAERKNRVRQIHEAVDNLENLLDENAPLLVRYWTDRTNLINAELQKIKNDLDKHDLFWDELPRGMNAEKAERTFFMRELKSRILEQYGKPHHNLIAVITSVIFDDEDITEDHVRKS